MENVLIYKATYRMENIFAEGFIILTNEYVEGIFANDYMAIYSENDEIITVSLQTLVVEVVKLPTAMFSAFKMNYISHQFSTACKVLCPGEDYVFFSNIGLDDLYLSISADTVEGEESNDILQQLVKLRYISQI